MKVLLAISLVIIAGCSKALLKAGQQAPLPSGDSTVKAPLVIPAGLVSPQLIQLTFEGESAEAYFSPDGKRLIFQSKGRQTHKNSQIYIYDLQAKREKRITYNDGDDTCAYFAPNGKRIIYASTTDEIKEHPATTPLQAAEAEKPSTDKYQWKFLPYEIYSADPDGSHIKRLTHSQGFDAEGVFSPDGNKILFTSVRDGDLELYTMDSNGKNQHRITYSKGYDGGGVFSPNGKLIAWRGFHDDKGFAHIFLANRLGKNIKQLTTADAINWCPFWHPDGKKIIFSSNRGPEKNFELYLMNSDGSCLKRLTYSPGFYSILPSFSPDGTKIAFTSNRSGVNQIYLMDFAEPKDCLPDKP